MTRYVAGNWKMNHGPAETERFFREFAAALAPARAPRSAIPESKVALLLFPPALSLAAARAALPEGSTIALGVQDVHWEKSGALTGEISAEMAAQAGARYALVGHSERRNLFRETDEDTRRKVAAVQRAGLTPLLCVGERIEERKSGRLEAVLLRQLDAVLGEGAISAAISTGAPFLLAYEPVWAIGTGETATPGDAAEAHGILRKRAAKWLGAQSAKGLPILYGGSVTPENAGELLDARDVGGVLVGGASLRPDSFAAIAHAAGGGSA